MSRRPRLRWAALAIGCLTLLPSVLATPAAAAPAPVGTASARGVRAIDFRGVEHSIDRATPAIAVEAVRHGDLDGDGAEEAVVVLSYLSEHRVEWFVQVFAAGGTAELPVGSTPAFRSSWEHFDRLVVHDGIIELTVRSGVDAGRGGWLEVQRWALVGDNLRLIERRSGGAVHTLDSVGPEAPAVLPDWATRVFLDVGPGNERRGVTFQTSEAKSLRMRADDAGAQVRLYDAATGRLFAQVDAGEIVALGGAGTWYLEPVTATDRWTRIELTVAEQRALYAPELVARLDEGSQNKPVGDVSITWYEVTWAHGPTDLDHVNGLIRGAIRDLRAEYEDAAARCEDETDSTLTIWMTPDLVSYDLISLRVSIASRVCDRSAEVAERSIVVDLGAGMLLDVDDLVTSELLVSRAWWAQFEEFQANYAGPTLVPSGSPLDFAALSLTARGVFVSVDAADLLAETLSGSPSSVTEFLFFEDYPGLIDADIQQRARSGGDYLLPYDGCSC